MLPDSFSILDSDLCLNTLSRSWLLREVVYIKLKLTEYDEPASAAQGSDDAQPPWASSSCGVCTHVLIKLFPSLIPASDDGQ